MPKSQAGYARKMEKEKTRRTIAFTVCDSLYQQVPHAGELLKTLK